MDTMLFDDAVLRRAQDAVESARANLKPIALDCAKAAACALLMAGAAYAEVVSATIAIDAAYPKLSDGTSTADAIMGMRYTVAFYALLGHVLISSITGRFAIGIKWLLAGLGLASILTMLLGMGLFSFAGTALTVGGDSEPSGLFGLLSGMAGPALGAVCGSLFVTGFIAAHFIAGRLLVKLGVISSAHAERAKVASLDGEINAANTYAAQIEAARRTIDEMAASGALVRKVAAEMARIVGNVASQVHEAVITRKSYVGIDLNDHDDAPLRDIALSVLEQMLAELKIYNPAYFTALLTKGE